MSSENVPGADNQQERLRYQSENPQRLYAELLQVEHADLESYLQGALRDGTHSLQHNTHRIGQSDVRWLELLKEALKILGYRSWIYREGAERNLWVLETTAYFLSIEYDANALTSTLAGLSYARGYFDAEGGMPKSSTDQLYFQLCQKSYSNLEVVRKILESWEISCGRMHNPSVSVDPDYWRFYVRAGSHQRFMTLVSSWHPRKRAQIARRMKI